MAIVPDLTIIKQDMILRRFDTADFSEHGKWLLPRVLRGYPQLGNDRGAATFLQNVLYNNTFRFLYQPHAVALFNVESINALSADPVVRELFVWVENPDDPAQIKQAAEFYADVRRWAKLQSVKVIIVEQNTDVPHDMIKEKLGRIFTRQEQFARL